MSRRRKPTTRSSQQGGARGRGKSASSSGARRRAFGRVAAAGSARDRVGDGDGEMRLNRWLAARGVASRRKCDAMILEGLVEVNGELVVEPGRRVKAGDEVRVDGRIVKEVRPLYYLFHKPKGVLCTEDPRENRVRVMDLVEPLVAGRVFTVGRLDEDSEGLLLLTNDGEFANLMAHPRYGVTKTYVVRVNGVVGQDALESLRAGVWLSEGKVVPKRVRISKRARSFTTLEIVMAEGRNREVRRMLARLGFSVKGLKRVRIGTLGLRGVRRGGVRPLSRRERDELVAMATRSESAGE